MKEFFNGMMLIAAIAAIPYAIAIMTPSWRWWLGVTLVIGGAFSALWIQDVIVSARSDYHEGAGGALGRAFSQIVVLGFAGGVLVRGATLVMAARGLATRYVAMICLAGFAVFPAILMLPGAWHAWKYRPPSEACTSATFDVRIADLDLKLPADQIGAVYLGKSVRNDAYYLNLNPGMRDFCSISHNGEQPIRANNVTIKIGKSRKPHRSSICAPSAPDWTMTYCEAHEAKTVERDALDFPLDIHVFSAGNVITGEFGGSRSSYDDSLATPAPSRSAFFTSATLTSDKKPLTFDCYESSGGYWCRTSYPWRSGASLHYTFRSGREDVLARGSRIDTEVAKFLTGLASPQ